MKKIMFNDKYGLTKAVFEGRKTQIRRILNPTMLFQRLNTYEGWGKEDIADWELSCKDRLYTAKHCCPVKILKYHLSSNSRNYVLDIQALI